MRSGDFSALVRRCVAAGYAVGEAPAKSICVAFDALRGSADLDISEKELLFDVAVFVARNNLNNQRDIAAGIVQGLIDSDGVEKLKPQEVARTAERRAAAKA